MAGDGEQFELTLLSCYTDTLKGLSLVGLDTEQGREAVGRFCVNISRAWPGSSMRTAVYWRPCLSANQEYVPWQVRLTHFTCHIHTGAHSVEYIDETPMASFSFPQVSSLCSGFRLTESWHRRMRTAVGGKTGSCWAPVHFSSCFLQPSTWLGGPPEMGFWVSEFGVVRGLPQRPASLVGVIFLLSPNLPGTPGLAEAWSVVRGQRQVSQHLWPGLALPWQQI